jgi:putative radical SAM enzyme (TIGR03279 family)
LRGEGIPITGVNPHSIAVEMGIEPGDRLLAINGRAVRDILEYRYYTADDSMVLDIVKSDGEWWSLEIDKDYDEDLGLLFSGVIFDRIRVCRNRCVFCFMDQLPPGVRNPLRIKDDDYRLSFLYGNFITLTNLDARDWERIITMRLSPLYVSVHSTNTEIRARMLGNPEARLILYDLERLRDNGLQIHTQIVLCPGINDKKALTETVHTLGEFWPTVLSIGIVPVGMTSYRRGLTDLEPVGPREAREVIALGLTWQEYYRERTGNGLVYLADEFFIKAGQAFPDNAYYDDYPQLENGIGMARMFLDRWGEMEKGFPTRLSEPREVTAVCGESAEPVLKQAVDALNRVKGLKMSLLPVKNRFFGPQVTVTGLLAGRDLVRALGDNYRDRAVLVPDVMLREGDGLFLDDMTIAELEETTGAHITVVEASADGLAQGALGIDIDD